MKGFSPRNLKYMRAFAAAWPERAIVQEALARIPWRAVPAQGLKGSLPNIEDLEKELGDLREKER